MPNVTIAILSYNMPEATNALVNAIDTRVYVPHDLIVFDNGSDIVLPSRHTTHSVPENLQTTGGWLKVFEEMDPETDYVWMLITSNYLRQGDMSDPLRPMIDFLEANPNAVGIHPSLTPHSTTSWEHLKDRGHGQPREVWMIDNIAPVWRWSWLRENPFDPDLTYAWGIDLEACYRARRQGRTLWVHEGTEITKETDRGYRMKRMNMSAEERRRLAGKNMAQVLRRKYGPRWWSIMTAAFVEEYMQ